MRYSDERRHEALACLVANGGNFRKTAADTGISERTLRRWTRQAPTPGDALRQLRDEFEVFKHRLREDDRRDAEDDETMGWLRQRMLPTLIESALLLADTLDDVDDAPLNQRATALNQVLGNILKLLDILPGIEEPILRVEFIDPTDGTAHDAPFWARDNTEERGAL